MQTTKVKRVVSHICLVGRPTDPSAAPGTSFLTVRHGFKRIHTLWCRCLAAFSSALIRTTFSLLGFLTPSMGRLQVELLSREGEGHRTPSVSLACFNHGPMWAPDKRARSESPSALLLLGEPAGLGEACGFSRRCRRHSRPPVYLLWRLFYPR